MKQTPGAVTVRFYDGMYLLATALNNMGPYDVEAADFQEKLNNALHEATYEGCRDLLDPGSPAGNCLNKSMIIRYDESGNENWLSNQSIMYYP